MIWIILPAYNEEASLHVLIPKFSDSLASRGEYRIVVVNDGSSDGTARVLEEMSAHYPIVVIHHPINRGLGEAERDGFEYVAQHCHFQDVVVRLDCDDTHEPDYIHSMLAKLDEGFDVVSASRFQPGGGQVGLDGYRAFVSRAANLFMRVVFGIPNTRDYSCGFRAYRGQVVKDAVEVYGNLLLQLRGLGFTSTLELLVKMHMLGCRCAEVPFVLRYDQKLTPSKMVSSITTLGYLVMAVLYWWPFGGWRGYYRALAKLYRGDREAAVRQFACQRRSITSQISF